MTKKLLAQELEEMGADSVYYDSRYGYVYAKILNNSDMGRIPTLAYIAHMDTSPEVSGRNVNPQIIRNYQGKDIVLGEDSLNAQLKLREAGNEGRQYVLSPREFPELMQYKGKDLITTDGTTLLGADDKAGVAEIMAMAEYLLTHPEVKHGDVAICFTPDAESCRDGVGIGQSAIAVPIVGCIRIIWTDHTHAQVVGHSHFGAVVVENKAFVILEEASASIQWATTVVQLLDDDGFSVLVIYSKGDALHFTGSEGISGAVILGDDHFPCLCVDAAEQSEGGD